MTGPSCRCIHHSGIAVSITYSLASARHLPASHGSILVILSIHLTCPDLTYHHIGITLLLVILVAYQNYFLLDNLLQLFRILLRCPVPPHLPPVELPADGTLRHLGPAGAADQVALAALVDRALRRVEAHRALQVARVVLDHPGQEIQHLLFFPDKGRRFLLLADFLCRCRRGGEEPGFLDERLDLRLIFQSSGSQDLGPFLVLFGFDQQLFIVMSEDIFGSLLLILHL